MKSNANRFRRLTSLALVLCLLLSSLPAAFAQEAEEEPAAEETVYVAPAVQEPVTEPVAPSVEEPAVPVEEEPVPPVTEEEVVPPVTEEEVVPAVTEEEPTAEPEEEPAVEPEEEPASEEAEEAEAEDEPCYVTVRRDTEIFSDSKLTDSEGKVQKDAVLYKTHTEDGIYTVLFAKDGEVQEGYIKADDCEIADEDAVAEYLLLAGADENAVKHTTKDNEKIVLLNAVVTEPAAEATVPEETEAETEPQEEATEAAEETEATEAAEEVTEETEAEEAEEAAEKDAGPAALLKGLVTATDKYWSDAPENVFIYQSDVKKVTIKWDPTEAASYVVYEVVGSKLVKRGTTNTNTITVSASTFGDHYYGIYPCSEKSGKGDIGAYAFASIYTYNQTWRKAPSVKVAQLTDTEGHYTVTWDMDFNGIVGYEMEILYDDGSVQVFEFDERADMVDNDTTKAVSTKGGFVAKGTGAKVTAEKVVVDKAAWTVTWYLYSDYYYLFSPLTMKIAVCRKGIANDDGYSECGKYSSWKTLKVVPQWSKAPKITSFVQTSDVECESKIEWTYTGEPDAFAFYSGKTFQFIVDAPESGNSAYQYLTHSAPGSYSFKIVPLKYHNDQYYEGKASGAKSARIALQWKTKKVTVNGQMISGSELLLNWSEVMGVDGYQVFETKTVGRTVSYEYITGSPYTSCIISPETEGYHTYVVRPFYNDEVGTFSAPKKVFVTLNSDPSAQTVYRAYVVGNTYTGDSKLTACVKDAQTMAAMLGNMSKTRYVVKTGYDQSASQILSGIASAFAGAKEGDVSLFYYSGHGMSNTGALVGNDYSAAHPDSYITFSQLRKALDQIPGDKIILLDSCFSGVAINKEQVEVTQSDLDSYVSAAMAAFANPTPKSGEFLSGRYYVITACRKDQTSAAYSDYSVFTRYFEQVCGWDEATNSRLSTASADTDRDGCITLKEAYTATLAAVGATGAAQVTRANPESSSFVMFRR